MGPLPACSDPGDSISNNGDLEDELESTGTNGRARCASVTPSEHTGHGGGQLHRRAGPSVLLHPALNGVYPCFS